MKKNCSNCKHWGQEMSSDPCNHCGKELTCWTKARSLELPNNALQHIPMTGFAGGYLHRINVPGGWLVIFSNDKLTLDEQGETMAGCEYRSSITFYPDPNHEWNAEEVKLVPTVVKE